MSLCLYGDEDFIHGWFKTIISSALLAHVEPWGFNDVQLLLDIIGAMCGLQHLHLEFESYKRGGHHPSCSPIWMSSQISSPYNFLPTCRIAINPICSQRMMHSLIQFYLNLRHPDSAKLCEMGHQPHPLDMHPSYIPVIT